MQNTNSKIVFPWTKSMELMDCQRFKTESGRYNYKVGNKTYKNYILAKNQKAFKFFDGLSKENPKSVRMVLTMVDTMKDVWNMTKYSSIKDYFIQRIKINENEFDELGKRPVILIDIDKSKMTKGGDFTSQFHEAGDNFTQLMRIKNFIIHENSDYLSGIDMVKAPTLDYFHDMLVKLSIENRIDNLKKHSQELRELFDVLMIIYKD